MLHFNIYRETKGNYQTLPTHLGLTTLINKKTITQISMLHLEATLSYKLNAIPLIQPETFDMRNQILFHRPGLNEMQLFYEGIYKVTQQASEVDLG